MSVQKKPNISTGMLVLLIFLVVFMVRFMKITLSKNVIGNLSYVQILNVGMPLIKATYYDPDAYEESTTTVKSIILETLNIKKIDPVDLAMKQIPYFSSLSVSNNNVVEKPLIGDISDLFSFNLNDSSIDRLDISEIGKKPVKVDGVYDPALKSQLDQSKPRVLIYHTHTTESYSTKDSSDVNVNVVGIGNLLTKELEENYGIAVIHDKTVHSISYQESYIKSRQTVEKYLNKYGDFELIIDLHRDSHDNKQLVTAELNGETIARLMFGVTRNNPNYGDSVKLADSLTDIADSLFPGLFRTAHERSRYIYNRGSQMFNQDLSKNAVLIEVGANCNTPQESQGSVKYLARVIAEQLNRK